MLQILVRDGCTLAHSVPEGLYKMYIIAFLCTSTFVEVYNSETDNNDIPENFKVNNGHSINVSLS